MKILIISGDNDWGTKAALRAASKGCSANLIASSNGRIGVEGSTDYDAVVPVAEFRSLTTLLVHIDNIAAGKAPILFGFGRIQYV